MCGFAGFFNCSTSNQPIDQKLLNQMQKTITHRGPDGFGTWKSNQHQIGLAHRRLSIIDLSDAGKQPMLDKKKSVVVVFNGEIYNHQKLRKELEVLGYSYFSKTDTETLLYAYKEWGINFIHKLDGMFSIVLYDLKKRELYLIRDRIGIKPLYFSTQGDYLSFASEIKALWHLPWMKKEVNQQSMYHCLSFMVAPAPLTLFKNVYKLPPAFYAKIDAHKKLTFTEWYTPLKPSTIYNEKELNDESFCIETIRSGLRSSIKKRMMSDVPVGVFLSGGIDSSLNVAFMSEISSKVKTFNVTFSDYPENDERKWANKISKHFGTDHYEIEITEKDAFNFFEKMVYHQDEPITDCVCVPLYYVAKLAKDTGVTVVQVGEGSDELFCGYSLYAKNIDFYNKYWNPTQKYIPALVRRFASKTFEKVFPNRVDWSDRLNNWAKDRSLFWSGAIAFPEYQKKDFFNKQEFYKDPIVEKIYSGLQQDFDSYSFVDYHLQKMKKLQSNRSFLDTIIYLEFKQRLPELLLMRVDKMSMATSIEGRVPFLDHSFVEFALQIPENLKYKNGTTKYILKKACEGILPNDVIYRKKIGFAAPTSKWFRNGIFRDYFFTMLEKEKSTVEPWINISYMIDLLEKQKDVTEEFSVQLWTMQNIIRTLHDVK